MAGRVAAGLLVIACACSEAPRELVIAAEREADEPMRAPIEWGEEKSGQVALPRSEAPGAWSRVELTRTKFPPWANHAFAGEVELPESAAGDYLQPAVVVVMSTRAIAMGGQEVVGLVDGRVPAAEVQGGVIVKVEKEIVAAVAGAETKRLLLFADRRVRFDQLELLFKTARGTGVFEFQVAVRRPGDGPDATTAVLRMTPARMVLVGEPGAPSGHYSIHDFTLAMWIRDDALEIGKLWHTGTIEKLAQVRAADGFAGATELARAWARELGEGPTPVAAFAAAPAVSLGRVVAAMESVSGPECWPVRRMNGDPANCWFADRIVVEGASSLWTLDELARP